MANEVTFKIKIDGKGGLTRLSRDTELLRNTLSSWTNELISCDDIVSSIEQSSWGIFGCLNSICNIGGLDKLGIEFSDLFKDFRTSLSSLKKLSESLDSFSFSSSSSTSFEDRFATDLSLLTSDDVMPRVFSYYKDWLSKMGLSSYGDDLSIDSYSRLTEDISVLSFAIRNLNDTVLTDSRLSSNESLMSSFMKENDGKLSSNIDFSKLGDLLSELSKLQENRNFLGAILGVDNERTNIQTGISQTRRYLARMFDDGPEDVLTNLQSSLKSFRQDLVNSVTIEGKLEASANISAIQLKIDELTHGKLSISAPIKPIYTSKGSISDKRLSYKNATTRLSEIKEDYSIGIIGASEARKELKSLNKEILSLGLRPIRYSFDTSGFKKSMETIKDGWGSIQGVGNGIEGISDALQSNRTAWESICGVMNGFISIAEGIQGIVTLVQYLTAATAAHTAATATDAAATAADTVASTTNIAAKSGEAIANATASGSKLPFPANLLAIAAGVAAVVAALSMISGAFATGGIVGGNQKSGDNVLVRVNSGEMILNAAQQARLFALANGAAVQGISTQTAMNVQPGIALPQVTVQSGKLQGLISDDSTPRQIDVRLKVRGRDIVAAAANETRSNRRRSNIKI